MLDSNMSNPEVCLFDIIQGVLRRVEDGQTVRVHTLLPAKPTYGAMQVQATRPFVIYELLRSMLEREGLSGMFVFGPAGSHDPVWEPFGKRDRVFAGAPEWPGGIDVRQSAPCGIRAETESCIDVLFSGAGETGWLTDGESDISPLLAEARVEAGHHALVMYLLSVHYSQPLDDVRVGLREANARVERIREIAFSLRRGHPSPPEMRRYVETCRMGLGCDLDTPLAFRALFEWLRAAELREDTFGDGDLCEMLAMLELHELLEDAGTV